MMLVSFDVTYFTSYNDEEQVDTLLVLADTIPEATKKMLDAVGVPDDGYGKGDSNYLDSFNMNIICGDAADAIWISSRNSSDVSAEDCDTTVDTILKLNSY